jgi:hypothetical protein
MPWRAGPETRMTPPATIVFPVDVDNTLLDNDHIQGTFEIDASRNVVICANGRLRTFCRVDMIRAAREGSGHPATAQSS